MATITSMLMTDLPSHNPSDVPVQRNLRLGVLVDSLRQPLWVVRLIEEVSTLPFVDLSVVAVNGLPQRQPARSNHLPSLSGIWKNRDHLLFGLYSRLDDRFYGGDPDPFMPVDLTPLVSSIPVHEITPRSTKHCDYFEVADCEALRTYHLDVMLRLGFRILKGDVLRIARHGVWSYHHGDNHRYRGGPAGFWEVMEGCPDTGSILQSLTDDVDDGVVLARRFGRTDRLSVAKTRSQCYWQSVPMVARKLRELYQFGPDTLRPEAHRPNFRAYSGPLYTKPKNSEMVRLLARLLSRRLRNYVDRLTTFNQWVVAYRLHASSDEAPCTSFYNFKLLTPPNDRFWADPFPVLEKGSYYVFFEEYPYRVDRGHISVMQMGEDRIWSEPRPVLVRPYHLSYPFVFRWEGRYYMVPESQQNHTVELYRCTSFPDQWELDTVLLREVSAVDTTICEHDGLWWMFLNLAAPGSTGSDENLHLYYAATPRGPWTAHPRNPIKSDVRSARSAGRVFRHQGSLYRPAQDCAERYGHAISLNRILAMNTTDYAEETETKVLPDWRPDLQGMHTLNSAPGLTVVDTLVRRPRFSL